MQQKIVPSYALYGTDSTTDDPGFLHVETLAISSRPYSGQIKAHRHRDLFQILLLKQGDAEVRVDEDHLYLTQPTIITLPPGYVHSFRFFQGTDGFILTLALPLIAQTDSAKRLSFMTMDPQIIPLSQQSHAALQIERLVEMMSQELNQPDNWRTEICSHLVHALLIWLQRATQHLDKARSDQTFSDLLNGFRHLLEINFTAHLNLSDYASKLNTSVATLNRHCRKHLGISAQALIHQRLNQEARRLLSFTQRSLEQVALELGFEDPAYFSRFFKRLNGQTPSQFRRTNNFGTEPS